MRRYSLFTLVVMLPLVAAIWLAVSRQRRAVRQEQALAMFDRAVHTGDCLPYARVVGDFGRSGATAIFVRAAQSDQIAFDGVSRLAHIQKEGYVYPDGSLDLLFLHDYSDGQRTAIQQPPIGTIIDRVVFVGTGVDVSLHGELLIDESRIAIPADRPEVYHLNWTPGFPPSGPPLTTLIKRRKRP